MSDFKFACPECEQHISADETYRGRQVQCPHCRHTFVVPAGEPRTPARPLPPPVRTPTRSAASSRWPTVLFWVGLASVGCVVLGLGMHRLSAPRRSIEDRIGKIVVIAPPGTPDACVLSASDSSPFARIRVQNPPGAITFVLELKKTVEEFYAEGAEAWKRAKSHDEFYGEGTHLHYGVARLYFDTDDNVNTGERGEPGGAQGYEFQMDVTLLAKGERHLAEWANAHVNLPKPKGHALRCFLFKPQPPPAPRYVVIDQKNDMSRGKVDGKVMWITVTYNELGVSPGQTVRITFMGQRNTIFSQGEVLPSFRVKLQ